MFGVMSGICIEAAKDVVAPTDGEKKVDAKDDGAAPVASVPSSQETEPTAATTKKSE